jgi:DHA1 family bicyclomycin/chloramphenicol resistance-like MFS transporter
MVVSSIAALGLGMAAFTGFGGAWSVLPMLFVLMGCFGLLAGNTMAGALNADPRRAGSISALAGGASFALGAMAAGVTAAFHDGTARPMATMILLAVTASIVALFALAPPRTPA